MANVRTEFKPEEVAISEAVRDGVLGLNPEADNYAGHFIYMGHFEGVGTFKHRVASVILEHRSSSPSSTEALIAVTSS